MNISHQVLPVDDNELNGTLVRTILNHSASVRSRRSSGPHGTPTTTVEKVGRMTAGGNEIVDNWILGLTERSSGAIRIGVSSRAFVGSGGGSGSGRVSASSRMWSSRLAVRERSWGE
jgi:hypothetical protein